MRRVKDFPEMSNHPETGVVIATIAYYYLCFMLIPFALPVFAYDYLRNDTVLAWIELVYHVLNGIIVFFICREHLEASLYYAQKNLKEFFLTVLKGLGLSLVTAAVLFGDLVLLRQPAGVLLDAFPISVVNVFMVPGFLVNELPVWGTALMTLATPIAVCGLIYAPGFAPLACKRPWLGYLAVTVLIAMTYGFEYLWHLTLELAIALFVLRLPIHLIACWTYQRSNSLLAPVAMLGAFNLIASLICVLFY